MATKVMYLTLWVVLTDRDRVAQLQTQYPQGANRAPVDAAVEFEAPFVGYTAPKFDRAPFCYTAFSRDAEGEPYPTNVATFERHTGGFWGIGGTTVTYYWMAEFIWAAIPTVNGTPPEIDTQAKIPKRRWIEGFETPGLGPCPYGSQPGLAVSRDASRHVGGLGLAFRGATNVYPAITATKYWAVVAEHTWERLYIRLRKKPTTGTIEFWRCKGTPSAYPGILLAITTTGQIAIYSSDVGGNLALLGTVGALEEWTGRADHHAWVKLDLLIDYVPAGRFRLFMRGVQVCDFNFAASTATALGSSQVGTSGVANDLALDIDDWVQSDIPTRFDEETQEEVECLIGKDFLTGSSVRLLRPTGFGAHHDGAAWTGDYRVLRQLYPTIGAAQATLASSTSGAALGVDGDTEVVVDIEGQAFGVPAFGVFTYSKRGSAQNGQLGYSLNGAAPVMVTITETGSLSANSVFYTNPGTLKTFPVISSLELLYTKGAEVAAGAVASLYAQVELCGKFGDEDYAAAELAGIPSPVPVVMGQHNAPYPHCPWAIDAVAAPIAPYIVIGGTYVGNGSGQDLNFRAPVHFFWVRRLAATDVPFVWLSTLLLSHRGPSISCDGKIVNAEEDPDFVPGPGQDVQQQRYRLRLAGNDARLNAIGVTYQYVAVCDPGMRYMLNLAIAQKGALASAVNNLINPKYLPEWAFIVPEESGTQATLVYAKGPEQAAATIAYLGGTALANALTFGTGQVTTQVALHGLITSAWPFVMSLWRRHDGNQDPGEPAALNVGTYVGDGSASRTVNLAPASGKRPLWAIVIGESGTGMHWRDPSHMTTYSNTTAGTEDTTGITGGGIDQFSVGSSLNANGVRYIYFVLFAGTTAGNAGWGTNGEYFPVEAYPPKDGPWPDDPPEPEPEPQPEPQPVPPDDLTTDIATNCVVYSTRIVNWALSRIGISKQITSLATDASQEAYSARLHYAIDAGRVLRDFPWPFATRYANLVRVAGTDTVPVNQDWQYSYRVPTNILLARRIVGQADQRRAYDPTPIPFRVGSDATGQLIYCNEPATTDVPLQLEYTLRIDCPASSGDPLFRSALAWRLAASLVAPLSRDAKLIQYCEAMYRVELAKAAATAAGEQHQEPDGDAAWISGRN